MNRNYFLKLLNSNTFSIEVFIEAAKILKKELPNTVLESINFFSQHSLYNDYIMDRYYYCRNLLIKHFQVNSIKNAQSNQVIKYY